MGGWRAVAELHANILLRRAITRIFIRAIFFLSRPRSHSFECVCGVKHIILCKKYVSRRRRRGRIYTRTHALLVVIDATVEFFSARFNARDVPVDSHGHVLIFIFFFSFFHQFDRDFHVQINI